MGSEEVDSESYEIAEEVCPAEALTLSPQLLKSYSVSAEYALVCRSKLDGIYIIPSYNDIFEWFGVLFIRQGNYVGGIFRFTLIIPHDFPETDELPVIRLDTEVFHPQIHLKDKLVDINRYFPDGWKRDKHRIVHVLHVLQRIFFSLDIDTETAANSEAAILWKNDKTKFRSLARQCVDHARTSVYEDPKNVDDPNCIRFSPWCDSEHRKTREKMKLGIDSSSHDGYSWLDTDTLTYMTEPLTVKMDLDSARAHSDRITHGIDRLDLSGVIDDAQEALPQISINNVESTVDNESMASPMKEGETTDEEGEGVVVEEVGESHI